MFIPKLGIILPNMGKGSPRKKSAASRRPPDIPSALFTSTQFKLMRLLFGRPDRSFFASELIALAKSGSGAVQRELIRLVGSGLVTQSEVGRQRHFQANAESPIFEELRGIVAKTAGVPATIRAALEPIVDRLDLALIYGSIARGEAHASSDVDLLVVGDDIMLEELYSSLESAESTLHRKINPTLYSRAEFVQRRRSKNPFLQKVLARATMPIIGNVDAIEAAR